MGIRLSDRVRLGPALASDSSTGPTSCSSLTRFSLVLLTVSAVRALNLPSWSAASTRLSRSPLSTAERIGDGL